MQSCIMIRKLYVICHRFFAKGNYTNHCRKFYRQMYLNAAKMKISFQERYFSFNRIILLAVGLWPYQQSKLVRFQITVIFGILISYIAFQVYISIQRILILSCHFICTIYKMPLK